MRATQSAAGRTPVPGGCVDGLPGIASRTLGRREGRAQSSWRPSSEPYWCPILGSVPGADSLNTKEITSTKKIHSTDVKISSCQIDEAQGQQGSIDGIEIQSENRTGYLCAGHSLWRGSRSSVCRLQCQHSFDWRQRQYSFRSRGRAPS